MTDRLMRFERMFAAMPLIAILRGIAPAEAVTVTDALLDAGITLIEVPLNSPEPLMTIEIIGRHAAGRALVGAGTVLRTDDVDDLARLGADMVISPNTNADVIRATRAAGLLSFPGCMTPSECFAALDAGAHALKLFPMEIIGTAGTKAMRAVLPRAALLIAVGGVSPTTIGPFAAAGCNGFGIGSTLYAPGKDATAVAASARALTAAWHVVSAG